MAATRGHVHTLASMLTDQLLSHGSSGSGIAVDDVMYRLQLTLRSVHRMEEADAQMAEANSASDNAAHDGSSSSGVPAVIDAATFDALREKVVIARKDVFLHQRTVDDLDGRIQLLIHNHLKAETLRQLLTLSSFKLQRLQHAEQEAERRADPRTEARFAVYEKLLYVLRKQPIYLARMAHFAKLSQDRETLLQTVIFTLFGDQYDVQDEHLLLVLFDRILSDEVQRCPYLAEFMRTNTAFTKMLGQYTQRQPCREYLEATLSAPLGELHAYSVDKSLLLQPSRVLRSLQNAYETSSGRKWTGEVSADDGDDAIVAGDERVRTAMDERRNDLEALCTAFVDAIFTRVEAVPYGVRYLCRQIRRYAFERFSGTITPTEANALSGGLLFLRYLCPAILSPDAPVYALVDRALDPQTRSNATMVCKVLQTLSNGVEFGDKEAWMASLNPFLRRTRPAFDKFIDAVCDVEDVDVHLQIDQYRVSAQKALRCDISRRELDLLHRLLEENIDAVDPVRGREREREKARGRDKDKGKTRGVDSPAERERERERDGIDPVRHPVRSLLLNLRRIQSESSTSTAENTASANSGKSTFYSLVLRPFPPLEVGEGERERERERDRQAPDAAHQTPGDKQRETEKEKERDRDSGYESASETESEDSASLRDERSARRDFAAFAEELCATLLEMPPVRGGVHAGDDVHRGDVTSPSSTSTSSTTSLSPSKPSKPPSNPQMFAKSLAAAAADRVGSRANTAKSGTTAEITAKSGTAAANTAGPVSPSAPRSVVEINAWGKGDSSSKIISRPPNALPTRGTLSAIILHTGSERLGEWLQRWQKHFAGVEEYGSAGRLKALVKWGERLGRRVQRIREREREERGETAEEGERENVEEALFKRVVKETIAYIEGLQLRRQQYTEMQQVLQSLHERQQYLADQISLYKAYLDNAERKMFRMGREGKKKGMVPTMIKGKPGPAVQTTGPGTVGPFTLSLKELEKRGVVVQSRVANVWKKGTSFRIVSTAPGVFQVTAVHRGLKALTVDIEMRDLLERQKNRQEYLEYAEVTLHINMLIHLLNKLFILEE